MPVSRSSLLASCTPPVHNFRDGIGRNAEDEHKTFRIDKIFQLKNPYKSIVEQISHEDGIDDFEAAADEDKLRIYQRTLEKIFVILGEDLQALSEDHLEDIKVSLREIINGFYYLGKVQIKYILLDSLNDPGR